MKKNKKTPKGSSYRLTSDERPTATNVDFPVFVPNDKGETTIEVGRARLRYGTLVVEFKDTAASVAIQKMIERGVLIGFGTVMIKPDVVNEMYQEIVANEEAEAEVAAQNIVEAIVEDAQAAQAEQNTNDLHIQLNNEENN
jgi:hypothetical protein